MFIEKIKIGNFGKLSCREFDLTSGVNILEGRNESGKTTFGEFIKFVFYLNISIIVSLWLVPSFATTETVTVSVYPREVKLIKPFSSIEMLVFCLS